MLLRAAVFGCRLFLFRVFYFADYGFDEIKLPVYAGSVHQTHTNPISLTKER